ncbi:trypsin-like serine peptidase [Streptomyces paludis]|uniref:V8-like Glu-specific endopeptidase n=1 Tax=Streptomyces paludis TaxID=2282738 RepID=A0A345HI65_9ACTN|nr:hypothetical protein [Streptomyces paludis]AXG76389.1 hypothetical protein DVK44_00370 [Streptomyces paludis]
MRSRQRPRPVRALACVLALLSLCVSACAGPGDVTEAGAAGPGAARSWQEGGWRDWDPSQWVREAADFINPVIDGLWKPDRMRRGVSQDQPVTDDIGEEGVSDPEPSPVFAEPVAAPYSDTAPTVGKLFFDTPDGPSVCSATVVADPANPGASNLVWTAGHCVHSGASGGWLRNIVFVPSYNDQALANTAFRGQAGNNDNVAPFGIWWADWAQTSPQWIERGGPRGGKGAPFDFAVLHVKPPSGTDANLSLEEAVGGAAGVRFDAPAANGISSMGIWGYPAETPFDGERMFTCQGNPGRLSIRADEPSLYRIGCTMTGGASGGGWFVQDANGLPVLVSNTSIGPSAKTWLAGPRLGSVAKEIYTAMSEKFA